VASACEALYAFLTGPLVRLIFSGGREGSAPFLALLPASLAVPAGGRTTLLAVAGALCAVALLKALAGFSGTLLHEGSAERIGFDLRLLLYRHLIALPLEAHRRHAVGDLLQRLLDDVRRIQEAAVASSYLLARDGIAVLALCAVACVMVPTLAIATLALLPLGAGLTALLGRGVRRAARQGQEALGRLAARAALGLAAVREVKSAAAEEREAIAVGRTGREVLRSALRQLRLRSASPVANEVMAALALGATLVYAGGQVAAGQIAPDRFVSFFTALLLAYRPARELARAHHLRRAAAASLERVRELLASPTEDEGGGDRRLAPLDRALTLRGVGFAYPGSQGLALDGIDLELRPGRVLALQGPSGAGKSTLANLVCGLERPLQGTITWDGVIIDRSCPLGALRREVSLVPQQPLLLDGTLAENLRYAAPDASPAEIAVALGQAGLEGVVAALPRGIETPIGAGGAGLSVGEVQRVALARALLKGGSVLVLDEPTAALDRESEAALCRTIQALAASRAVLLIAHGAVPLAIADQIVGLEAGRLAGEGGERPGLA
jgi:ABC-type multidrug transport system fused ATPase/permease subunit